MEKKDTKSVAPMLLLVGHALLLMYSATRLSPTNDEPAHLAAGLANWQTGEFRFYAVNPPLVKLVAAAPVVLAGAGTDTTFYTDPPAGRQEFSAGQVFVRLNGARTLWLMTLARWACIPFSLLGGWVCYCWSRELFGHMPGLAALTLWCVSPMILGHGSLITADVASASMFVATCFSFRHWLLCPTWRSALVWAVMLGTALLVKFTCLLLVPLLVIVFLYSVIQHKRGKVETKSNTGGESGSALEAARPGLRCCQLICSFAVAIFLVNAGCGFDGSGTRLRDYNFVSQSFSGQRVQRPPGPESGYGISRLWGNRFRGHLIGDLPIPLPKCYLQGIDLQRKDFESPREAYLFGTWRSVGFYSYYVAGTLVKTPVGTLTLLALALGLWVFGSQRLAPADELLLILPTVMTFGLCSSQINMTQHLRYVLPAWPFLLIWMSRALNGPGIVRRLSVLALVATVVSSLSVYPNSIAFFNVAAGGPAKGNQYLLHSNLNWGQNFVFLKEWMEEHPESRPMILHHHLLYDAQCLGLECTEPAIRPTPGWHAVAVSRLRHPRHPSASWFRDCSPVDIVGDAIHIFHITPESLSGQTPEPAE